MQGQLLNKAINKIILKAILQNMAAKLEQHRQLLNQILQQYDINSKRALERVLYRNNVVEEIFKKQVAEYFSWQGGFAALMRDRNFSELPGAREFRVDDFLISVIHKVNLINPHGSYFMEILSLFRKKQWDKQFGKKWGELKNEKFQQRMETSLRQREPQVQQPEVIEEEEEKPRPRQKEKDKQLQKNSLRVPPTLTQEKQKMFQIKRQAEKSAQALKHKKIQRTIDYLDYRSQFHIATNSKEAISKEIILYLQKFMSLKCKEILHSAKLSHQGYNSPSIGTQFKTYAQHPEDQNAGRQAAIKIPKYEGSIQFRKLQMPSKLQQQNKLRIQEQKQEEYYRNQVRSKVLEFDKKSDRFLQNYTFEETRPSNQIEEKVDLGAHKTARLKITAQNIQWALASDPYFCDGWVMQRSLYQ